VVIHDVFKHWGKFFIVNEVEEYFIICCDIYSDVTFNEIKKTFVLKFVVLSPVILIGFLVINSLEEQNVARTSANEAGFFDQKHGSEINITNLFDLSFNNLSIIVSIKFYSKRLSLSIESIDFMLGLVPKTFVWEIKW